MGILDSLDPPPSEYIRRWADAMEKEQYDSALSALDEVCKPRPKKITLRRLVGTQISKNLLMGW